MSRTQIDPSLIPTSFQNSNNIVLNGGFELWSYGTIFGINQSLYNSGSLPTSYICADFWQMGPSMPTFTTGILSYNQNSTTQESGAFALDMVVSSVGTTTQMFIQQFVPNPAIYRGKTITVAARVKCNTVGKINIRVIDSSGNTDSALNVSTGVYETLTVTKTLASNTSVFTIQIGNISQAIVTGTTTIDSVMVTLGSFSQSYTPSDTGIDKIKAFNPYLTATNIMENGGLEIWQRGNTFTNPAAGAYTADRWQFSSNGVPTLTISKETTNTDNSPSALKWNLTSVGTGTVFQMIYKFEAAQYVGQTVSLKARIRVDSGGIGFVQMNFSDAGGSSPIVETMNNNTATYETISLSRVVAAGTTTMSLVLSINNNPGVMYLDNFMLVAGGQPVDYVPMNPEVELARCQRYYETGGGSNEVRICTMTRDATQNHFYYDGQFSVNKRVNPTMVVTPAQLIMVQNAALGTASSGADTANWTMVNDGIDTKVFNFVGNRAQTSTYSDIAVQVSWTASADF